MLWPFGFAESISVQFRGTRYIMRVNRTSEWKLMTFWICWELPLLIFEHLDLSWASIIQLSEKWWPFEFFESIYCSISCVSIYHGPQSYNWVKSYARLNLPRAFVFNFVFTHLYYFIFGSAGMMSQIRSFCLSWCKLCIIGLTLLVDSEPYISKNK